MLTNPYGVPAAHPATKSPTPSTALSDPKAPAPVAFPICKFMITRGSPTVVKMGLR